MGKMDEQVKYSLFTAFFVVNALVTCVTGWAGAVGFTPVSLRHKGYYDHQRAREERRMEEGNLALSPSLSPRDRVLALGDHPKVSGSSLLRSELLRCNRQRGKCVSGEEAGLF